METTHLYQPVHPQYQQRDDPEWREALSRALRRCEMDRERQREEERTCKPQRYQQQN